MATKKLKTEKETSTKPKTKQEPKYYSSEAIRKIEAVYNIIYGSRSFGKSFDMFYYAVENFMSGKNAGELRQYAYLRRYSEDLKGKNAATAGDTLVCDGEGKNRVVDLTNGLYNSITYFQKAWYLQNVDRATGKVNRCPDPFMLAFSFPDYEHMKGGSYPFVTDIWFEEFMGVTGKPISKDEFVIFQNIISTIARGRHVRIWMTGNTTNPFSPYWDWMGLTNAAKQKPGTIDVYRIGNTDKKIAVERTIERKEYATSKASNAYLFAFDDPKLKMITTGDWEVGEYPLFDGILKTEDIVGRFYIQHKDKFYRGDIVSTQDDAYIYIHKDTDPLDTVNIEDDLIYSLMPSVRSNYRIRLDRALTDAERWIVTLFSMGKVFYDENWTGVAIADYRSKMVA